ncbi:unnamed protein product [Darwinula stevensoni]|uniref:Peptidase S1 domain-containing protein n=1 Tax=Darwinula stevensoni TaxID=69355 RepID=A0A7R9ACK1_9CRUS|nr:unnamed protein product [Darwinula stevensoni]CAG0900449.1 unnamed protein product [Darwinula stevensoni]
MVDFQAACRGDSGSPMVFYINALRRWQVEGIVSHFFFDEPCSMRRPGQYSIFTRVNRFVDWIQTNIEDTPTLIYPTNERLSKTQAYKNSTVKRYHTSRHVNRYEAAAERDERNIIDRRLSPSHGMKGTKNETDLPFPFKAVTECPWLFMAASPFFLKTHYSQLQYEHMVNSIMRSSTGRGMFG